METHTTQKTATGSSQDLTHTRKIQSAKFPLIFFALVLLLNICEHRTPQGDNSRIPDVWNFIEEPFCNVQLDKELRSFKNPVITFARAEKGELAVCLGDGLQGEAWIVALAGKNQLKSPEGETASQEAYKALVLGTQTQIAITYRTIKSGTFTCLDKYQLIDGKQQKLKGMHDQQFQEMALPAFISSRYGVSVQIGGERGKGVLKSYGLDVEYNIPPRIRNVVYGMEESAGMILDSILAVYNEDVSPPEPLIRIAITEPGMKVGIFGNALPNRIRRTSRAITCDAGFRLHPCNPDWDLSDLWLSGLGDADEILGIDDPDTRNVIYGDFMCGTPPTGSAGGRDVITGGPGNDFLAGEEGDDFIYGGAGNDVIYGNLNNCGFTGGSDSDHIFGDAGHDRIYGDTPFRGEGGDIDYILGGGGSDTINAGPGNDDIFGDTFSWGSVTDWGNDKICGGPGSDFINGGLGRDELFIDSEDVIEIHPDEIAGDDHRPGVPCLSYFFEDEE